MGSGLPDLGLEEWKETKDTLHLWCQIVGKVRLALTPRRNHWWNVALYVSTRGLTTRRLPVSAKSLELELDLRDHRLRARTVDREASFDLVDGLSVAGFYERLFRVLDDLGIDVSIRSDPFGVPVSTPFRDDMAHSSYDPDAVGRYLQILQWSADVFEEFAGWFNGKTSPVHLFWHSFDLALTRFSGRPAPPTPGADPVTAEAYSHEVVSFGFWAGDRNLRHPAYYSYTAPEPDGRRQRPLRPGGAEWVTQRGGSLALLDYGAVRTAADPRQSLLEFLQSSFEAGASRTGWDLLGSKTAWCPVPDYHLARLSLSTPQADEDSA